MLKDMEAPKVCGAWGDIIRGRLLMPTSFRHYYYAKKIHKILCGSKDPVVAEIGGGWGGFAYYLLKDNPEIQYMDFDLPSVTPFIKRYLKEALPGNSSISIKDPDEFFSLDKRVDVVVNTHSFSEMAFETIKKYLAHAAKIAKFLYIDNRNRRVHGETPINEFPVPADFKLLEKSNSPWCETYEERLYENLSLK